MSETAAARRPAWLTSLGVVVGYGILLAIVFVLFFVVPYVFFLSG